MEYTHTLAAHLSVDEAAPAKMRRNPLPESDTVSSLRPLVSELVWAASCFLLHGCHVAPIFLDTHTLEIRLCPTVKSKDINPNNISSAWTKRATNKQKKLINTLIVYSLSDFNIEMNMRNSGVYLIWSFLVLHTKLFYVSSSTTASWCNEKISIIWTQNQINMSKQ